MVHDYMLQLSGATFAGLAASGADLIITESGLNAQAGVTPTLTAAELASLGAQGKVVVGYVNTCVTDHNRSYWNPAWVSFTDPAEKDVGAVTGSAPAWLSGNLGTVDFAPETAGQPAAPEAFLVDYRNQDWRNLVIAQAVAVVSAGYGGVFLDDIGRYFDAGYHTNPTAFDSSMTDSMMALVTEVAAAVRAVNPAAFVVVNSDPFIGVNASAGQTGAVFQAYDAAVDAVLEENHYASQTDPAVADALTQAVSAFTHAQVLALESLTSGIDLGAFLNFAGTHGILPFLANSPAYDAAVAPPKIGTAGNDRVIGANGGAILAGLAGDDSLLGGTGADRLFGHSGNDTLRGGLGRDSMDGGAGNDSYIVQDASDLILDAAGVDRVFCTVSYILRTGVAVERMAADSLAGTHAMTLVGNDLAQVISGNAGMNRLNGKGGADVLAGYGGADIFVFDTRLSAANIDRISDFNTLADHIALENAIFTGLAAGAMQASAFVGNRTGMATTTAQRILYETDTGALFFDANGSGAGGRQQFATLLPGLALTAGDFLVL